MTDYLASLIDPDFDIRARDKREIPSVGRLARAVGLGADYSMVPDHVLENARQRGKRVHDGIVRAVAGEYDPDVELLVGEDERVVEMVVQATERLQAEFELHSSEVVVHAPVGGVELCGVVDWIATHSGKPTIIDVKTSAKLDAGYVGFQTAAYALILRDRLIHLHGEEPRWPDRWVLWAPYRGRIRLRPLVDDEDYDDVLAALRIYQRKVRYGEIGL